MSEPHEEAHKREAAALHSVIPTINKARRCLLRGDEHRRQMEIIPSIEQYAKGIEILEKNMSQQREQQNNDEAIRLLVTLCDIRSTSLELGQRCAFEMEGFHPPAGDYENAHMAMNNRTILSDCTYVLEHRAYATPFQIKKCRQKRMNAAWCIDTRLGKNHRVTPHERTLVLEDAASVLDDEDGEFGVSWKDDQLKPVRKMALATRINMGVPVNDDICANVLDCNKWDKPDKLSICSRCRSVKYCSRECQREHYKVHKRVCRARDG